jgi:uncharacterized membrane protein
LIVIALLFVAAVPLRCIGVTSRWLWLDELLTVNWADHGVWAALVNVMRFDLHPPLYYLQLSLWALAGHSDVWYMANTIFWSAAAVSLLAYVTARVYGVRAGLYAGILLAVSPAALAYADDVRMYSFLIFLITAAWYVQERWLNAASRGVASLWLVISQEAIIFSHSAGVIMLAGLLLYGLVRVVTLRQPSIIVKWILLECLIGLLALPAVGIALMRGASHTRVPDFAEFLRTWQLLIAGDLSMIAGAGIVVCAIITALILCAASSRRTVLVFVTLVVFPFIAAATVSHVFKPMWLPRIFLPTVPFICLVVAVGAAGENGGKCVSLCKAGIFLVAALWAVLGTYQQFTRTKGDGYKPSAELVHQIAHPGDLVLVDGDYDYWCFLWYYAGHNWGEPRHAFILNDDWARMMKRLPAKTSDWLGLNQSDTDVHLFGGRDVHLWDRSKPTPESSGDLIVVRKQSTPGVTFDNRRLTSSAHIQQMIVERWTKNS